MGPRPSFRYRRSSSRLGHSRQSLAPTLPPAPLQNLTNRPSLQQSALQKPPRPSKRLSIAEPPSKKTPRQKKFHGSWHKRVQTGIPEEQRLKMLLESAMLEEYERKYADASAEKREHFEEAMLQVLDFLEALVADTESHETVARKRKPNPRNTELEIRAVLLEEIINNYKAELEKWDSVEEESAKPVQLPAVAEGLDVESHDECLDPEELVKTSSEVIETCVLQSDHLRNILRKLESRNRETHSRVQAVAAALNDHVMSQFGKKTEKSEGGLTPPPNMASMKLANISM